MITMMINIDEAAKYFQSNDNFLLLCHISPDGDTVGSAAALARALASIGKKVNIKCGDKFTRDFDMLLDGIEPLDFEPEHIVAVDVADNKLLGSELNAVYVLYRLAVFQYRNVERYHRRKHVETFFYRRNSLFHYHQNGR